MNKRRTTIIISLALVLCLVGCASTAQTGLSVSSVAQDSEYLQVYFGVAPFEPTVTGEAFDVALKAVVGKDYVDEDSFSPMNAVVSCVKAASLDELAQTYGTEKAAKNLAKYGISGLSGPNAQYVACALDSGLIDGATAKTLIKQEALSSDRATELVMAVVNADGKGRQYLGYSDDADIEAKLANALGTVELYSNPELDGIGAKIVQEKVSTGFNLKKEANNSRFLPSLTLRYGHDSAKHAKQLVALLNSEGIRVRIQVEPKTSIYEYLLDWGPVPEPSATYRVEKYSDDLYLVHAVEYDMSLEFANEADLVRFNSIIEQYSKKYDDNQKEGSTVKLISGAWWQPLYSATFNPDASAYKMIYDNILYSTDGSYSIHPYSLAGGKDALDTKLVELSGHAPVVEERYVNNAFYRYLTGEDHQ